MAAVATPTAATSEVNASTKHIARTCGLAPPPATGEVGRMLAVAAPSAVPGAFASPIASAFAGAPWLVALVFGVAGALHFLRPRPYEHVMPRWVPASGPFGRRALVFASGAFEILGALGVLYAPTRAAAGWGLVLLLAAVLPANVEMLAAARRARAKPWVQALFVARLPLQPLMMWWVWAAAVRDVAARG